MSKRLMVAALLAVGLIGGCSKQSQRASMGLMHADEPVAELGAGDALGRQVHLTALLIAARDIQADQAWAFLLASPEEPQITSVIGRLATAPGGTN